MLGLHGCAAQAPAGGQPAPAYPAVVDKKVRRDPTQTVQVGAEYYPLESRLSHEEGVCVVKITVHADATVSDISLTRSTSYPRLDDACLRAFASGGLLPATEHGVPITSTVEIPITWKLSTN
jgi:periplasmic protein TonB